MLFLFISCYFQQFFYYSCSPVVKENIKLKLALSIPTGAPIILVKEIIDTPQLVADKTIKAYSK